MTAIVNRTTSKEKKCARCDQIYPIYQMAADSHSRDGLKPYCLECDKQMKRARRAAKGYTPNYIKRLQIDMEIANANGYYWCGGFNPGKYTANGHLAHLSDFGTFRGKRKPQCRKCLAEWAKYSYTKRKLTKAVQE